MVIKLWGEKIMLNWFEHLQKHVPERLITAHLGLLEILDVIPSCFLHPGEIV